jgi:tetratricopeptide (TPR) repeat protein
MFSVTVLLFCASVRAECPPASSPLWQQAAVFQQSNMWFFAAQIYAQILANAPDCQRAAVMFPVCELQMGLVPQALSALPGAIAMNPVSFWAEPGLYYLAAAQQLSGNNAAALQSIGTLSQNFPESVSTVRAQIIAAQIAGNPLAIQAAIAAYEQELLAATQFQAALQADNGADGAQALILLDAVIAQYPNSGASLRALEAKGHIHERNQHPQQVIAAFQQILDRVGESAPQSQIVANAKLEGAGGFFELLQFSGSQLEHIPAETWQQLRNMCEQVVVLPQATALQRARASLMIAESYWWQRLPQEGQAAAESFIAGFDPVQFKAEMAMAHLLAGECLQAQGQHQAALPNYQWIQSNYAPSEEVWQGMDHLPRAYYRVVHVLLATGAPQSQAQAAAAQVATLFPNSQYASMVMHLLTAPPPPPPPHP